MVQRAALIAAIALVACRAVSNGEPTGSYLPLAALEADAASALVAPDAEVIRRVSGERFDNITGPEPSFTGAYYGVQTGTNNVLLFYDGELRRLGWVRESDPIPASGEALTRGWCKVDMRFRIAIVDPGDGYDRIGLAGAERFATVFKATLLAARGTCPSPVRTMPPP